MTTVAQKIILNSSGWYWPASDENNSSWNHALLYKDAPLKFSKFVKNKQTCVTAGANCGFYVKQYAYLFNNVYTFEPEAVNFHCLNLNVTEPNVFKFQSFLGNEHKLFNIELSKDSGGHNLGKNPQPGNIPMLMIDDLNLTSCDLIQLDVEGAEIMALYGARETIKKFNPVIVVEIAWSDATNFLEYMGYEKVAKEDNDWIFLPK